MPSKLSPNNQQQLNIINYQLMNTSLTIEALTTRNQSKKRKFGEMSAQGH
jgi:hypothetical protein